MNGAKVTNSGHLSMSETGSLLNWLSTANKKITLLNPYGVYLCPNYSGMRKLLFTFMLLVSIVALQAQQKSGSGQAVPRPKLVVGIMVDQMRWDYLYRYYDRYSDKGFRRMLREGASCENTMIPYAQTVTAAGHTSVYTGSTPALHGIMGNEWFDKQLNREIYCAEDKTVKIVGAEKGEPMSPANLWATTICDELRIATNFRAKTIGIAIKDRGGILPAGHSANAAYWYDGTTGNWITSTYYMQQLPEWADRFNKKRWVDTLYKNDWNTLFPINSYLQSTSDNKSYEGKFGHEAAPVFPHDLKSRMGKDYGTIRVTPFGNTLTLQFSKEALKAEGLGKDAITDFLAISLSSPDYIGHQFGPNSIEAEDNYLRLDRDLADFFNFLDKEVGAGQYTVFLTADHAVAHVPGFNEENKLPGRSIASSTTDLNKKVQEKFRVSSVVRASANYQIYLNDAAIDSVGADRKEIKNFIIKYLNQLPDVLIAFDNEEVSAANLPSGVKEMFLKGYNTKRAGDIQIVLKSGSFFGGKTGTTHGSFYSYDAHIPLLFMGWGIQPGKLNREVYMTDIAPTIAAILRIQAPSATIGKPIPEVIR